MSFKKLALVSAMFAATSGAFAMEALDEEAMAATTGQDGISIGIQTTAPITMNQIIHDGDGYNAGDAGAIVITGMSVDASAAPINIVIDADGGGASGSFLNINIATGALSINTGDISVAESNGVGVAVTDQSAVLLSSSTIAVDSVELNIQLGAEPQGAMIRMQNTVVGGGLTISNFSLNDTSVGGGSIGVGTITMKDWGATGFAGLATADLTIGDVLVDVVAGTGLEVQLVSIGGANGLYQSMENVTLGGTTLGDIEITGLVLSGTTITIAGH